MTIKQQGGIFGRNPTFNDVDVEGTLTVDGNAVPDASTLLVDSDIGVTVQGYDADTTKNDVANTFTADQTISKATNTTLSVKSTDAANDRNSKLELLSSGNGASKAVIVYGDTDTTPSTPSPLSFQGYHSGSLTEHIQFTTAGNIKFVNSGNGIDFSATSGTGTSELFSDYEEGNWTPAGNGVTLASAYGHYTKVGRLVNVYCQVTFPTTSDTNPANLYGLPYTIGLQSTGHIGYNDFGSGINKYFIAFNAGTHLRLYDDNGNNSTNATFSGKNVFISTTYGV